MPALAPALSPARRDQHPLLPLAARTAGGESDVLTLPEAGWRSLTVQLVVTAGGINPGDSLQVTLQHRLDGANWDDLVAFTPVGAPLLAYQAESASLPRRRADSPGEIHLMTDLGLAPGTLRACSVGSEFRARWTVVSGGPGTSYTFAVSLFPGSL